MHIVVTFSLFVTAHNFVVIYLFCIGCNKSWFALILQQRQKTLCRHHFRSVSILNAIFFSSAVVAVVCSYSSVQFDTVCSVFSHHTLCLLNSGDEQSTPIHSAFFFLYLQMFLFWFREWIISIFMSFQHMFSVLFIYFIFFALYRRFVYLCFVLSRAYFFSDKLC